MDHRNKSIRLLIEEIRSQRTKYIMYIVTVDEVPQNVIILVYRIMTVALS